MPLRILLKRRGIDLIAPDQGRRSTPVQDKRKLRRYRRRWKVERVFAWMGQFRRLVTRWEHSIVSYAGFLHLALTMITLRQL